MKTAQQRVHMQAPLVLSPKLQATRTNSSVSLLTDNLGDVMGTSTHGEGPQLDVALDGGVLELAADQALGIEHCTNQRKKRMPMSRVATGCGQTGWKNSLEGLRPPPERRTQVKLS